ncbi:MAG: hypothetical protein ABI682_10475 [Acidobacteriota bacterium]
MKIKFFRPQERLIPFGPSLLNFISERGPFDVTASLDSSAVAAQSVVLSPPVHLQTGDVIAITNLTSCGGPVYTGDASATLPPPPPSSLSVPGDELDHIAVESATPGRAIFVQASGPSPFIGLLQDRFAVLLSARNPRNRATTAGFAVRVADGAGYFSLPDFTGDPSFPQVVVKMVDATGFPALGGSFWFFHSPLTDVTYTLTVRDQFKGATRTYTNGPGSPGQLCGGVDTSAFRP